MESILSAVVDPPAGSGPPDIDRFLEAFRREPAVAGFLLDFDGTLSEIVPHPHDAVPVEGAPGVLAELAARYRVVALVSGRRAADLAARVGASGVRYIGLYGAEEAVEGAITQPEWLRPWIVRAEEIAREAEAMLRSRGLEGCQVESKGAAVSIHYRNAVDPQAGGAIWAWASERAGEAGFTCGTGRMVVELRPPGVSKAGALETLVGGAGLRRALAAGDDAADVEALRRAQEILGPAALRVGVASAEEPPGLAEASDVLVGSPAELVGLLRRFV